MTHPDVTMATETIHNPNEPRHYLRAKPVPRLVRVKRNGQVIAESRSALRVTEVAKDIYDPVFYFPKADITADLSLVEGQVTHCPLKGDASYFRVDGSADGIAWSYESPLDFMAVLTGLVAFCPDEVSIEEVGAN